MTDHFEIARLKHSGRRHILRKRHSLPHTVGLAQSRCGVEGWFDQTIYKKPNTAALPKYRDGIAKKNWRHYLSVIPYLDRFVQQPKRDAICEKCFNGLMMERRTRHEAPQPVLYWHFIYTWLKIVPRGISKEQLGRIELIYKLEPWERPAAYVR